MPISRSEEALGLLLWRLELRLDPGVLGSAQFYFFSKLNLLFLVLAHHSTAGVSINLQIPPFLESMMAQLDLEVLRIEEIGVITRLLHHDNA